MQEFSKKKLSKKLDELNQRIDEEDERLAVGRQEGTRQDVDAYEVMKREKMELEAQIAQLSQNVNVLTN